MYGMLIITARVGNTMGGYIFSLFVCSHLGVPHLHPIILSLVPCPFPGGTPVTGPSQVRMGYPTPGQVTLGQVMPRMVRLLRFPEGGPSCFL